MKTLPYTLRYATRQKLRDGEYPAVNPLVSVTYEYPDLWGTWSSQHMHTLQIGDNLPLSSKIWGSHSAVTYCWSVLGCYAVLTGIQWPTFRGNSVPSSSGSGNLHFRLFLKLFHRQKTLISSFLPSLPPSFLPSFLHSLSFILINNHNPINPTWRLTCTRKISNKFLYKSFCVTKVLGSTPGNGRTVSGTPLSTGTYRWHTEREERNTLGPEGHDLTSDDSIHPSLQRRVWELRSHQSTNCRSFRMRCNLWSIIACRLPFMFEPDVYVFS